MHYDIENAVDSRAKRAGRKAKPVTKAKRGYAYHVAYQFTVPSGWGVGSATIHLDKKIEGSEQVQRVRGWITEQIGNDSVVLINWLRLPSDDKYLEVAPL